jgi:hypothetical protein
MRTVGLSASGRILAEILSFLNFRIPSYKAVYAQEQRASCDCVPFWAIAQLSVVYVRYRL